MEVLTARFPFSALRARFLFLITLAAIPAFGMMVYMGLEQREHETAELLVRSLAVLGIIFGLVLAAVWVGIYLFILRPLEDLLRATKRLSSGDLSVRTGLPYERGELSQLARSFDDMANMLEQQESKRQQMEEELRALLLVDELTGLYNRRGFLTLALQELKLAHRLKKRMILVFADLDDLKRINDTLGHPEGDRALIKTAGILKETFRESDIVARIGGDEFVVLAVENQENSALRVNTRLQEKIKAHNAKATSPLKLSVSVGIACYDPRSPCSIDELLARADNSMYERKRSKVLSHSSLGDT